MNCERVQPAKGLATSAHTNDVCCNDWQKLRHLHVLFLEALNSKQPAEPLIIQKCGSSELNCKGTISLRRVQSEANAASLLSEALSQTLHQFSGPLIGMGSQSKEFPSLLFTPKTTEKAAEGYRSRSPHSTRSPSISAYGRNSIHRETSVSRRRSLTPPSSLRDTPPPPPPASSLLDSLTGSFLRSALFDDRSPESTAY